MVIAAQPAALLYYTCQSLLSSPEGPMVIAAQPAAPGIRWPKYAARPGGPGGTHESIDGGQTHASQ
jgi:hypothetical protein